jgi:hypothetical protein
VDFLVLVSHLRPDLAKRVAPVAAALGTDALRRAAAPAYLRRTKPDVPDDLPLPGG